MSDPTCLLCDGPLIATSNPDAPLGTAPWQCTPCARGFFDAEFTPEALALFRPDKRDYGPTPAAIAILDQIEAEATDTSKVT